MIDAAIRAEDGDVDGALDSCRAIFNVARSIGDEPFLISGLVRVAIGNLAMKSARRALAQGEPSEDAMAKLQALALDELAQPLLLDGIRGERGMLDEHIRRIADREVPFSPNNWAAGPDGIITPWAKVLFDAQRVPALEMMQRLVTIARLPPHERPSHIQEWEADLEGMRVRPYFRYISTYATLMMPSMETAERSMTCYQADLACTVVLLAAERQRRRSGDWPTSIEAIDFAILPEAPKDPFTGEPLLLGRVDDEFLVYSVGPNLDDEEGRYDPKRASQGFDDDPGTRAWDVAQRRRREPEP